MKAVSAVQLLNAPAKILTSPEDASVTTDAREEQPWKAFVPIYVTLLGSVMEVSAVQPLKAFPLMVATYEGAVKVTLVKDV